MPVPSEIGNVDKTAAALCGALDDCSARDRTPSATASARPLVRVRGASGLAGRGAAVAALELDGVGLMKKAGSTPNKDLAAHVLGYVGSTTRG